MTDIHLAVKRDVAEVVIHGLPDSPGIAADIFGTLGGKGLNIELVVSSPGRHNSADIVFALSRVDLDSALETLRSMQDQLNFDTISFRTDIAILTLSWHMLAGKPGSAGRIFSTLSKHGVNIQAISTSLSAISCIVRASDVDEAEIAVREEFDLS